MTTNHLGKCGIDGIWKMVWNKCGWWLVHVFFVFFSNWRIFDILVRLRSPRIFHLVVFIGYPVCGIPIIRKRHAATQKPTFEIFISFSWRYSDTLPETVISPEAQFWRWFTFPKVEYVGSLEGMCCKVCSSCSQLSLRIKYSGHVSPWPWPRLLEKLLQQMRWHGAEMAVNLLQYFG